MAGMTASNELHTAKVLQWCCHFWLVKWKRLWFSKNIVEIRQYPHTWNSWKTEWVSVSHHPIYIFYSGFVLPWHRNVIVRWTMEARRVMWRDRQFINPVLWTIVKAFESTHMFWSPWYLRETLMDTFKYTISALCWHISCHSSSSALTVCAILCRISFSARMWFARSVSRALLVVLATG